MAMNEQETALVVHAIETGIKTGGESSKNKDIAQVFRLLRTILFDCFLINLERSIPRVNNKL